MKTLNSCLKIPLYNLFYYTGYFQPLPLSYTIALTHRCNCRCLTCRIYEKKDVNLEELSYEEYKALFLNLGQSPYWVTFTGGEPFLREDIVDIISSLYRICRPKIINIATNGTLTDYIIESVKKILISCHHCRLILNLSIDDLYENHDYIRGSPGCYEKVLNTFTRLKEIKSNNFVLGINTVLSKYNTERFPQLYDEIRRLNPDSFVTEIAQEREELNNIGLKITPSHDAYAEVLDCIKKNKMFLKHNRLCNIIWNIRLSYYNTVKNFLQKKPPKMKCFAGVTSCYISPYGELSFCCMKLSPIGNLRAVKYNFKKLWFSFQSGTRRRKLRIEKCNCTLANVFYTNLFFNFRKIFQILINIFNKKYIVYNDES